MAINQSMPAFNPAFLVTVLYGVNVTGYFNGDFLTIRPSQDLANNTMGAIGEINTNIIVGQMSEATMRLTWTNPTTKLLKAAFALFTVTGQYLPTLFTYTADLTQSVMSLNSNPKAFPTETYSFDAANMSREYAVVLHNTLRI